MDQIIHPLKDSATVLLASHANPDGDAIGSLVAMGLALEKSGKTVTMYNDSPIPAVYRFLPGIQRIRNAIDDVDVFDTAVILDCGDLARIGCLDCGDLARIGCEADRVKSIPMVLNIDHHITNTGFGDAQLVDTTACATAELIYRLIQALAIPIDLDMATSLSRTPGHSGFPAPTSRHLPSAMRWSAWGSTRTMWPRMCMARIPSVVSSC